MCNDLLLCGSVKHNTMPKTCTFVPRLFAKLANARQHPQGGSPLSRYKLQGPSIGQMNSKINTPEQSVF